MKIKVSHLSLRLLEAQGAQEPCEGALPFQRSQPCSFSSRTPAPLLPAPVTESPQKPHLGELTVTDVTPDSVSLSWTVPEGEFDSFIIKYKDRDGQPQVVSVAADQLEVTVPGLEPSRKYKFMLFGIQDGRRHGPVSVEAKTGERNPHEAEPEAPAFPSFFTLPRLVSLGPDLSIVHLLCFI